MLPGPVHAALGTPKERRLTMESLFISHPFFATFGTIALLLALAFVGTRLFFSIRERLDRPYRQRRQSIENLAVAIIEESTIVSFALSTNSDASKLHVTCTGEQSAIQGAEMALETALKAHNLQVALTFESTAASAANPTRELSAHLLMHAVVSDDHERQNSPEPPQGTGA